MSKRDDLVEAITRLRKVGDPVALAEALRMLGEVERSIPQSDGGIASYEEAVRLMREQKAPLKLAHTIRHLGDIYRHQERCSDAAACYDEALKLYRSHPERSDLDFANALRGTALLKEEIGEREQAVALWRAARELYAKADIATGVDESTRRIERLS